MWKIIRMQLIYKVHFGHKIYHKLGLSFDGTKLNMLLSSEYIPTRDLHKSKFLGSTLN